MGDEVRVLYEISPRASFVSELSIGQVLVAAVESGAAREVRLRRVTVPVLEGDEIEVRVLWAMEVPSESPV